MGAFLYYSLGMKLQSLVESETRIEDVFSFLRERYPDRYELLKNWEELNPSFETVELGEGRYLLFLEVPEEDFEKLTGIFPSKEEAMGAFLTAAMEVGWEEVPESYVIYHADFDGDKLIAAIKTEEGVLKFDQLHLEEMIRRMLRYPRVVVYSSDVLTYIKDVYPEVDSKAYVISREIARVRGKAPDLEDLGRIYGVDTSTLEGKLRLLEELLKNPIRLPDGEVNIRPYYYPLEP